MAFYGFIWWLSIWLAVLSLALMTVLVIRRVVSDARLRRREARRKEMLDWLLEYLTGVSPAMAAEFIETEDDAEIVSEVIEHLLRSLRGEERERLVAVLRSLGGIEKRLAELRHGKEWQRVAAANTLRYLEGEGVLDGLRGALDDPSPAVRSAAARALFGQHALGSVKVLVEKLVIEAGVPPHALRDIFRRLGPAFHAELLEVLQSGDEQARVVAIDALGHSGDLQAVEPLLGLLDGASKEIAANVFRALAILGDPRAVPAVLQGLRHPDWEVRCQAALCAGQIRAHEARSILTELLDDSVWWVRYRAAEALFELGERGISVLRWLAREATSAGQTAQLVLAEKGVAP
jgi:HEAT repeat protein